MFYAFQILTVMLVAVAMAQSLAHALELPGKLRLSKEHYLVVQPIYYPGFTIGGIAEPLGVIATLALVLSTPARDAAFWPALISFVALLAAHLTYWVATHPVNTFWLRDQKLKGAGGSFFAFDFLTRSQNGKTDWTALRDRWEYSHVVRAVFAAISFLAVVIAVSI